MNTEVDKFLNENGFKRDDSRPQLGNIITSFARKAILQIDWNIPPQTFPFRTKPFYNPASHKFLYFAFLIPPANFIIYIINIIQITVCAQRLFKQYDNQCITAPTELHEIFAHCYEDIMNDPISMLLPIYDMNEYGYFSKEARTSREESYKYAKIFYVLGYSGELRVNVIL